ncbi:MAG: hypothetical protein KIT43_05915 [Bauldia sp.]|nr:hypothetical protein [Bauldia sp.]MCW5719069.1 hypothetical protein [Bauldia sp.]
MAFGDVFDGYCVIHAPFAAPHRRAAFESSLASVGVNRFTVIEARRVASDDPRVAGYTSPAFVSLIDAWIVAIETAREAGWRSVIVFEDDIVFRPGFTRRWAQVEQDVRSTDWDVLTLYRWYASNIVVERVLARTRLLPIRSTLATHAVAVRVGAYAAVLAAIAEVLKDARPIDLFNNRLIRAGGRVVATSHNLAGQSSSLNDSTMGNYAAAQPWRRSQRSVRVFNSYQSAAHYGFVLAARAVFRIARRARLIR